jgi:hypothetical protein
MADNVLTASIRAALEGLLKQREAAQEAVRRQQIVTNSAAHNLEKAKDAESWAIREANEKSDNLTALINLANSKPVDERSAFQGGIAHLQNEQLTAARFREQQEHAVLGQEKERRKEEALLKDKQEKLALVVNQISVLQSELEQALR